MRALPNEPHDGRGNALACHYCDRRARSRIGPNLRAALPLCDRHNFDGSIIRGALLVVRVQRREARP